MIKDFGNRIAFDLFQHGHTNKLPIEYCKRAIHLLDIMDATSSLGELKIKGLPPSLRLHRPKGAREDEYVIDIHKLNGWRITINFVKNDFYDVKIEDYY